MPGRTRTGPAESKAAEGDAAPDAEQAAPEQPADEAQTTSAPILTGPTGHEPGKAEADRHADLTGRLDALHATLDTIGDLLGKAAATEAPALDLGEVHDRFDLLTDALDRVTPGEAGRVPDVLGKVLELMREVDELGKGGTAPQKMGGYAFRKVDDAIDAVGTAVRRIGLVLRSEVVASTMFARHVGSNPNSWGARVTMRYVFVSPVDGSEHTVEGVGEGADSGDKATSKAVSMALKYALLQGLLIPVEGAHHDVESDDTRAQNAPRDDRRRDDRPRGDDRRDDRPLPRDERRDAPPSTSADDPPEARAREILRRAQTRDGEGIRTLLGKASEAGLANVEVEWFSATATLQQHMISAARLADGRG